MIDLFGFFGFCQFTFYYFEELQKEMWLYHLCHCVYSVGIFTKWKRQNTLLLQN